MNTKMKSKWWIDMVLFAGFLVTFFLDMTGVVLHQWIGILIGALALYHLIAHWEWVSAVTQRFFGRTSGRARLYLLVDVTLLAGFIVIVVTGLVISTWLNLSLTNLASWRVVHITASIVTLVATGIKLGLHWRWIAMSSRNLFGSRAPAQPRPIQMRAPVAGNPMNRRDFFKVAGVVGAASFFALTNAAQGLHASQDVETAAVSQTVSTTSSQIISNTTASTGSNACVVRCGKRCSFPGQCRRYVDTNSNNLCDNGECL